MDAELLRVYADTSVFGGVFDDEFAEASTIFVSWNFKHIVHFQKIPLYNAVNTLQGYGGISIYSPREVIRYEDEDI